MLAALPRSAFLRALRHRAFALLWTGQTVSRLGDSLYQIALAWWVLEKTGSAAVMGTVLIFSMTPTLLFLLVGGVAVDRIPRLRVMLASDLLSGAVAGGVAFLAVPGILPGAMLFGASMAAFSLIWTNTLQEMVPRHMLGRVSSIDSLGSFVFMPVGFGVVGWATDAVGAPLVFVVGGAISAGLSVLGLLHRGVRQMD